MTAGLKLLGWSPKLRCLKVVKCNPGSCMELLRTSQWGERMFSVKGLREQLCVV